MFDDYRKNLTINSKFCNVNENNFFSKNELNFIWNQPRKVHKDHYNREPTIFKIELPKIKKYLKDKVKEIVDIKQDFIIDNVSILRLDEPTKPHIDGNYPYYYKENKKYVILKFFVVPILFEHGSSSSLVTFKQHYNHYNQNGFEFDKLIKKDLSYFDFKFEDAECNQLKISQNNFITKKNFHNFKHITDNDKLSIGIDIENINSMKEGDIISANPYQIHCTTEFEKLKRKWVLRFILANLESTL